MESQTNRSLAEDFAAACAWWRDAGVDQVFHDAPEALLKATQSDLSAAQEHSRAPPEPCEQASEGPVETIGGDRSQWPGTLAQFREWWLSEPSLGQGSGSPRLPPRGPAGSKLMVLVPMPESEDQERLLSGKQGAFLANILRAMQLDEQDVYIASALPSHTPFADWHKLAQAGLGETLLHHAGLVAPERVLVLGRDLMTLLGKERKRGVARITLHKGEVQALAGFGLEGLLANATLRADLWRRWLDWTGSQ